MNKNNNPITAAQAQALVRLGRSYDEVYGWDSGYAGKVLREEIESRRKARGSKKTIHHGSEDKNDGFDMSTLIGV